MLDLIRVLFGVQVGNAEPIGMSSAHAGLDCCACIVDMHVHIPQTLASHDDQGVAQRIESHAQFGDRRFISIEQEHHLVGRPDVIDLTTILDRLHRCSRRDRSRTPNSLDNLGQGIEHDDKRLAACIDHPRHTQGVE